MGEENIRIFPPAFKFFEMSERGTWFRIAAEVGRSGVRALFETSGQPISELTNQWCSFVHHIVFVRDKKILEVEIA